MAYTHLKAKELFKAGKIDEAWVMAQKDEGWIGGITKQEWKDWMQSLIDHG